MRRFASLALAACAFALPALAQDLPTLRIGLAEDADALDPSLRRTCVGRIVMVDMCDTIVPRLATSCEWADGLIRITGMKMAK